MMRAQFRQFALAALSTIVLAEFASAQRLVVSHDEWYSGPCCSGANEQRFVSNTLNWFGLSSGASVLIYSSDTFLTNPTFTNFLTASGISVTIDASATSFSGYAAVIAEGNPTMNAAGLASYVFGGGNVLYMGGTGVDGSAAEAVYSNAFLNAFGFSFASTYNGLGTVSTVAFATEGPFGAALFTGVPSVFANSGNTISLLGPVAGVTSQLFSDEAGSGVFGAAVFATNVVPEPATVWLLAGGLLALAGVSLRRRMA